MKVIAFISAVVVFLGFMWFAWRDGYTQGVMKERREKIKTIANFNNYQRVLRSEISLLRTDLDDVKSKLNEKPLTFNYDHASRPIGKVVNAENSADDLLIHVKEADICK